MREKLFNFDGWRYLAHAGVYGRYVRAQQGVPFLSLYVFGRAFGLGPKWGVPNDRDYRGTLGFSGKLNGKVWAVALHRLRRAAT